MAVSLFAPRLAPVAGAEAATLARKRPRSEIAAPPPLALTPPPPVPVAGATFASLGVAGWLVRTMAALGIRSPTPIQSAAIPAVLAGRDVVGCAQTGSGKTAAFAVPILQRCMEDPYGPFALVLTPSRELALQIAEQFTALGSVARVRVTTIVGGMDIVTQGAQLATQPHIIVATPGRLAHHFTLGTSPPDLSRVAFLVLDEADRMLEGPFQPDLHVIIDAVLKGRERTPGAAVPAPPLQTLLFSATVTPEGVMTTPAASDGGSAAPAVPADGEAPPPEPPSARLLAKLQLQSPAFIDVTPRDVAAAVTVETLRQHYVFMPDAVKNAYLWHVITLLLAPSRIPLALGIADRVGVKLAARHKKASAAAASTSAALKGKTASPAVAVARGKDGGAAAGSGASAAGGDDGDDGVGADASGLSGRARSAIIFTSTCLACQTVTEMLQELGIPCTPLHSVMPQHKRAASLAKFKSALVPVLVATDVGSRGLDIPIVDCVINYDLPRVPSDYIHRVGRTARAGRGGVAVSFITQYDVKLLQTIEQRVLQGRKMSPLPGVEEEVVLTKLAKVTVALQMAKNRLEERGFDEKLEEHEERKALAAERTKAFLGTAAPRDAAPSGGRRPESGGGGAAADAGARAAKRPRRDSHDAATRHVATHSAAAAAGAGADDEDVDSALLIDEDEGVDSDGASRSDDDATAAAPRRVPLTKAGAGAGVVGKAAAGAMRGSGGRGRGHGRR